MNTFQTTNQVWNMGGWKLVWIELLSQVVGIFSLWSAWRSRRGDYNREAQDCDDDYQNDNSRWGRFQVSAAWLQEQFHLRQDFRRRQVSERRMTTMCTTTMMVVTTMFTKMMMTMIITLLCNPSLFSPGGDCSTCISLGHQQVRHRHQIDHQIKQLWSSLIILISDWTWVGRSWRVFALELKGSSALKAEEWIRWDDQHFDDHDHGVIIIMFSMIIMMILVITLNISLAQCWWCCFRQLSCWQWRVLPSWLSFDLFALLTSSCQSNCHQLFKLRWASLLMIFIVVTHQRRSVCGGEQPRWEEQGGQQWLQYQGGRVQVIMISTTMTRWWQ